jgi:hypothetical protein
MTYAKRLLSAFSLCLLSAVALMAFTAAPALAEGNWRVAGTPISETVQMEGEIDSETLGFLVPSLNFQLVFNKITYDTGSLLTGGESSVVFLLTEGAAYTMSPKKELPNCKPGDLTFKLKGSLFLHNGKTYEYLVPAEKGAPLTVTTYSEGCSVGEEVEVRGSIVLESVGGSFEEEAVKHLVRQAPSELFPGKTPTFGVQPMSLSGSWWTMLKGKWGGLKWSGLG